MPGAQVAPIVIDQSAQKPVRRNLFRSLRRNFHCKCLASTLLIEACFAYVGWCHIKPFLYNVESDSSFGKYGPCANAYRYVPLGFAALLYLIYMFECWHNRTKLDALPKCTVSQFLDQVERLRAATPVVWWKSVCYHYLRRTKHVTRYRNGDAVSATQVYYERVNSHTSGNVFMYDLCGVKDISKDVYDVDDFGLVRVRFSKGFVFACVQAADEFEDQRTRFFNENEVRDDYMEVREGLDFAECRFVEQALVFADERKRLPPYMRAHCYWTLCALLLGWPLRVFIDWRTAHLHYQLTKLFGTNYLSPSSVNYTGPLTRVSTIDTIELERANRQNYLIVPSYSEAVLMDPIHTNYARMNTAHNDHTILTNYGAIGDDDDNNNNNTSRRGGFFSDLNRNLVTRSRSMSFPFKPRDYQPIPSTPVPRPTQLGGARPPRSISMAGTIYESTVSPVVATGRNPLVSPRPGAFHPMPPPIDEPPPPYEVALRMCAPLYQRLRQSASHSIGSLLNALSRSSSKDLRLHANMTHMTNMNNMNTVHHNHSHLAMGVFSYRNPNTINNNNNNNMTDEGRALVCDLDDENKQDAASTSHDSI